MVGLQCKPWAHSLNSSLSHDRRRNNHLVSKVLVTKFFNSEYTIRKSMQIWIKNRGTLLLFDFLQQKEEYHWLAITHAQKNISDCCIQRGCLTKMEVDSKVRVTILLPGILGHGMAVWHLQLRSYLVNFEKPIRDESKWRSMIFFAENFQDYHRNRAQKIVKWWSASIDNELSSNCPEIIILCFRKLTLTWRKLTAIS